MKRIFWPIIAAVLLACGGDDSEEIFSCEDLSITLSELNYTDCGGSNGSVRVLAEGGREPYRYRINDDDWQQDNQFVDLETQYYNIFVEDANGCIDSVRAFLGSVEAVRAIALTSPSGCGTADGSIEVIARNGQLPYRYQLGENTVYTDENTFTGLTSGEYSVWVKDDRDCFLGIYPVVLTGVTEEEITTILDTHCSISGCHDSDGTPDFTDFEEAEDNADAIIEFARLGTEHYDAEMPNSELETIICWASDLELKNR